MSDAVCGVGLAAVGFLAPLVGLYADARAYVEVVASVFAPLHADAEGPCLATLLLVEGEVVAAVDVHYSRGCCLQGLRAVLARFRTNLASNGAVTCLS